MAIFGRLAREHRSGNRKSQAARSRRVLALIAFVL
jgi:hypothetical protein